MTGEPNAASPMKEMGHRLFRGIDSCEPLRYTDRVTELPAMGSMAGAIGGMEDCDPSSPVLAMAFRGTADPIVSLGYTSARGARNGSAAWALVP